MALSHVFCRIAQKVHYLFRETEAEYHGYKYRGKHSYDGAAQGFQMVQYAHVALRVIWLYLHTLTCPENLLEKEHRP